MSYITLTASAADELARKPAIRAWEAGQAGGKIPLLFYYHRCHSNLDDGTLVEHGDGFGVSLVDPSQLEAMEDIVFEKTLLPDGRGIFVRVPEAMLADDFSIGWSNGKFTIYSRTS